MLLATVSAVANLIILLFSRILYLDYNTIVTVSFYITIKALKILKMADRSRIKTLSKEIKINLFKLTRF